MATHHESVRSGGGGERMSHMPTDPVCGMSVEPEHAAGTHVYHGETYYFCSQTCLERFAAPRNTTSGHRRRMHLLSTRPPRP